MANADAAKAWIQAASLPVSEHFAAVSTNVPAAVAFGVQEAHVFGFRGLGRRSLQPLGPGGIEHSVFSWQPHSVNCWQAHAPWIATLPKRRREKTYR